MRAKRPDDDHFFRVEVTVNACIATPDDRALGNNVADVTLGFSASMERPPAGIGDAEITAAIARNMSPVLAAIQTVLTMQLGYAALGMIDDPMADHGTPTGEFGKATPVTVRVSFPTGAGVHD